MADQTRSIRGIRALKGAAIEALNKIAPEEQSRALRDLTGYLKEAISKNKEKLKAGGAGRGAGGGRKSGGGRKASGVTSTRSTRRAAGTTTRAKRVAAGRKGGKVTAARGANRGTTSRAQKAAAGRKGGEATATRRTRSPSGISRSRRSRNQQSEQQAPSPQHASSEGMNGSGPI